MSLSGGYMDCCIGDRALLVKMSDPDQTPLQEAISSLTIAAILVGVACYVAALRNIPIASPALFWVASLVYH